MSLTDRITGAMVRGAELTLSLLRPTSAPTGSEPDAKGERRIATPGPYWDRDAALLGNALTPQRLTRILQDRNQGDLRGWVDLLDEFVEHDPHLFSQLSIRAESVVETEFYVAPGQGTDKRRAQRAADACGEILEHWRTRDEELAWDTWVSEWVWAKFYGRSVHEVLWDRDGRLRYPEGLELIDTRRIALACDPADPDPWDLRIWDEVPTDSAFGEIFGRPLREFHPDTFLAATPRVRGAQKTREGLGSIVAWFELFRVWSWRELMALAEMVSRPPVIAYYNAGGAKADGGLVKGNGERKASPEEVAAANAVVRAPTGALRAVLADTVHVEALKFALPTTDPVPLLTARECERLVSKAIHGVANLSDLQPGARAAVESQERTTHTFYRSDCRMAERLGSRLFGRVIRANPDVFREGCPLPRLVADVGDTPNRDGVGRVISIARESGILVPEKWAREQLGVPAPADGEAVLPPAAPTPSPAAKAPPATSPTGTPPTPTETP